MATLAKAIELAAKYHGNDVDKGGAPYILHPMRVANRCTSVEAQICGWLHDAIEDTEMLLDDLMENGFDYNVVAAIRRLTRVRGENYADYIIRCKDNPLAREVKIADLLDNLDASRLPVPVADRHLFNIVKYNLSLAYLNGKINEMEYLAFCAENGVK